MLLGDDRKAARSSASFVAPISDVAVPAQVAPSASKAWSFSVSSVASSISLVRSAAINAARSGSSFLSGATLCPHFLAQRGCRGAVELVGVEAFAAILHDDNAIVGARCFDRDHAVAHIVDDAAGIAVEWIAPAAAARAADDG